MYRVLIRVKVRSDSQTRVQISLNSRIRCKTDMVVKAVDVWNWDWKSKKTVRCNYPGEQMSSGGGGLSWMLLYGCCFKRVTLGRRHY